MEKSVQERVLGNSNCRETSRNFFELDLLNGRVVLSSMLSKYLGCKSPQLTYNDFMAMIPNSEYNSIYRIHQILLIFYNTQEKIRYDCTFILIHNFKTAKGKVIKVLRELYFLSHDKKTPFPICHNNCVDITNMHFTKNIIIDIRLPKKLELKKQELMRKFSPILQQQVSLFSTRELEVLKAWETLDTVDEAALQLGITKRTLQVHLKNMRKKLSVKRSMDVLLYAKEQGWI